MYVQSDTLLLADVFRNFQNISLEIYGLQPARFLTAPGLAWKGTLKKTKLSFDLLTDMDMSLVIKEGIKGGICQAIY